MQHGESRALTFVFWLPSSR